MTQAEALDHAPWVRGKYRGKTASEVAEIDAAYLVWAYDNWQPRPCSHLLYQECRRDMASEFQSERVALDQDVE